jgi:hypothetical protein
MLNYVLNILYKLNVGFFGSIVHYIIEPTKYKPNDIDCVMSSSQYKIFMYYLVQNKILFKFDKYIVSEYVPFEDPSKIIIEYNIVLINNIKLDIFIYDNNTNIYDAIDVITSLNIDFYCNSLRYINNELSINHKIVKLYSKKYFNNINDFLLTYLLENKDKDIDIMNIIFNIKYIHNIKNTKTFIEELEYNYILHIIICQIKDKNAISISNPDTHRIEKMKNKGWNIEI